ncbi:MAG: hypothetical protein M1820_008747 [Bogoriella megaspora]|nr:MAG: hypothetical protein M1820_008747 [Bogoriella megaspora]
MKRKNEDTEHSSSNGTTKKRAASPIANVSSHFRPGLFDEETLSQHRNEYATSTPYKHAVIPSLISPTLLHSVRHEIKTHLSFTPKETDIYRLHQSGDLANLSGLDSSSLSRLPSLLTLRDALYSPEFRTWLADVAQSGPLSGKKTDMAINVYTPGDHLLCHDDVIGSRRVSYILYLTDPEVPWRAGWGGGLRLYPLEARKRRVEKEGARGKEDVVEEEVKVPSPEWSRTIPPEWNQLAFFAVQPGESFHDVEEVYHREEGDDEEDGGRVRMAISGWFHVPQEGEEGYEEGLEKKLAEKSSLAQLQGNVDEFDAPQPSWNDYDDAPSEADVFGDESDLSEEELSFLLQFMNPKYLTPDTVEELDEMFGEESSLRLADFLSKNFSVQLSQWIKNSEIKAGYGEDHYSLARPPHKHRFLYMKPSLSDMSTSSPVNNLLDKYFSSWQFRKWLQLATGLSLGRSNLTARRFRKGLDYTLATPYEEDEPQLEFTFGMTTSDGWEAPVDEEAEAVEEDGDANVDSSSSDGDIPAQTGSPKRDGPPSKSASKPNPSSTKPFVDVGGHEVYTAAEDPTSTADPAQYKSASSSKPGEQDEDDNILFSAPPSFNHLSVVLRDKGVLRFVKYVSRKARGDRWDIVGEFAVNGYAGGEDDEEGEDE